MARSSVVSSTKRDIASHKRDGQGKIDRAAFGLRVSQAAAERGVSDAVLAREAGIGTSTFSRYKSGEGVPNSEGLFPLSDALRRSPRWLLYGENERTHMIDAADADWVEVSEFSLADITDRGLGKPLLTAPIRRDWLYTNFRATKDIWLARLLSDYTPAGLEEDQLVICRSTDVSQLAEGNLCLWRVAGGIVVGRFSRALDAQLSSGRAPVAAAFLDPSLGIGSTDLVVPPSRAGSQGPYHLIGRILGIMFRPL